MKFEDAFCDRVNRVISIQQAKSKFEKNAEEFAEDFKNNLWCPECRKAQLSFKNASTPYFSTYPNAHHADDCSLKQGELTSGETKQFLEDNKNKSKIVRQVQSLLQVLLQEQPVGSAPKSKRKSHSTVAPQKLEKDLNGQGKRIPRKRIDTPFCDEDFGCYKLFYGNVNLTWEKDKNAGYNILLRSMGGKKFLCRIRVTDKVFPHIPNDFYSTKAFDCKIVFLAEIRKAEKGYGKAYLEWSEYLTLVRC